MIIQSKNVWINEKFSAKQIETDKGIIVGIYEYDEKKADVDYEDNLILPGFIDIHCHGYAGVNSLFPTVEGLRKWSKYMPQEGVTSYLVGLSTQSFNDNCSAMETISQLYDEKGNGAEILGINMEGDFISHEFRGAQDEANIVSPDPKRLEGYHSAAKGRLKTVTCAVELDENFKFCDAAKKMGIAVSVGHSGAKYEDVYTAVLHGLKGSTHTGNGMRGIHQREPGTLGSVLVFDELYAEVIGDCIHVHPQVLKLIGKVKGKDKLILVTDSSPFKDYDVSSEIEGYEQNYNHGDAFILESGTLCGSSLKVNKGIYNLVYKAMLPIETAINSATINPAKYIGEDHRKGTIVCGKDADLVVCDREFNIIQTYCMGNECI